MRLYAVFGNPIHHSKSPFIHHFFAKQCHIPLHYETRLASVDHFEQTLDEFFQQGGRGANITVPFKERAFRYCDTLTKNAMRAGAVNTIKWSEKGQTLGDNTDGIGLVSDLLRLDFLKSNSSVLLLGAGGAARGVIAPLLSQSCSIVITNRTFSRAQQLANDFADEGDIQAHQRPVGKFDLIINATSSGLENAVPHLPERIITDDTACYDMFYHAQLTSFLRWSIEQKCLRYADGRGMLVGQAAHSFKLWHGVMPDINAALTMLEKSMLEKSMLEKSMLDKEI